MKYILILMYLLVCSCTLSDNKINEDFEKSCIEFKQDQRIADCQMGILFTFNRTLKNKISKNDYDLIWKDCEKINEEK